MPRVLMVVTSLEVGGAQRLVADLALALRRRSWDVSVVSLLGVGTVGAMLASGGVRVHALHMRRGRANPKAIADLRRIVRDDEPDVVHSHMIHANLLARVALIGTGVPLVNTIHNETEGTALLALAQRLTRRLPDVTTTVSSSSLRTQLARHLVDPARSRHLPSAIDLAGYLQVPARPRAVGEPFSWLALARLAPQKGLDKLVEAAALVEGPLVVTVAGEGPLRADLTRLIAARGMGDRVILRGVTEDVAALLGAAHGLVLPSLWEGLPLAVIEGSAAGLPCVASSVGGVPEAIDDGSSGLLVPPGDAGALASAMTKLMEMPDAARLSMGERARSVAAGRFDLADRIGEWDALYRQVVAA